MEARPEDDRFSGEQGPINLTVDSKRESWKWSKEKKLSQQVGLACASESDPIPQVYLDLQRRPSTSKRLEGRGTMAGANYMGGQRYAPLDPSMPETLL